MSDPDLSEAVAAVERFAAALLAAMDESLRELADGLESEGGCPHVAECLRGELPERREDEPGPDAMRWWPE